MRKKREEEEGKKIPKKRSKLLTIFGVIFILGGLLLIAYPFIEIGLDKRDISKNINEWDKQRTEALKNDKDNSNKEDTKKGNKIKYPIVKVNGKDIIGKLVVTKTGEQIPILMGATEENLRGGATLYDNGIYPGDKGTAIILGHRETTFGFLENIKDSDIVEVQSLNHTYKFKVKKTYITNPEDESILAQEEGPSMTLVTCYPFRYVGPAPDRFIVKLDLIE
ncbi:class D sortase [Clostridium sardiniense]|uniref:Class D sortase n=1 Tax=Clostridium sardiniense TaxID=29369 RepID=A0ABS7L252_CLOSR|nr:class D sortase [Clostridium sardiniense]MBM7836039.1 sortase A [Clostridium sardiniense]MBY0757151.1 class D sortase [Clostridium sardiniense]MDQ0461391.1 sortase A [Clostridium sardiniense]